MPATARLSINLPAQQVRRMKAQARVRGVSLSGFVGELLAAAMPVISPARPAPETRPPSETPLTDACVGIIRLPPKSRAKSDRQLLAAALARRHRSP